MQHAGDLVLAEGAAVGDDRDCLGEASLECVQERIPVDHAETGAGVPAAAAGIPRSAVQGVGAAVGDVADHAGAVQRVQQRVQEPCVPPQRGVVHSYETGVQGSDGTGSVASADQLRTADPYVIATVRTCVPGDVGHATTAAMPGVDGQRDAGAGLVVGKGEEVADPAARGTGDAAEEGVVPGDLREGGAHHVADRGASARGNRG